MSSGWVPVAYLHREREASYDQVFSYIDACMHRAVHPGNRSLALEDASLLDPGTLLVQQGDDSLYKVTGNLVKTAEVEKWHLWLRSICWPMRPLTFPTKGEREEPKYVFIDKNNDFQILPDERLMGAVTTKSVREFWRVIVSNPV